MCSASHGIRTSEAYDTKDFVSEMRGMNVTLGKYALVGGLATLGIQGLQFARVMIPTAASPHLSGCFGLRLP
jgi:hypothetical protein